MTKVILTVGLWVTGAAWAAEPECKVYKGGFRIDTKAQLEELRDACEIGDSLGIFLSGVKEITFPNLKRARLINVEADDLEAVSFPKLESVDYLYIGGGDLKVADLPALKNVAATLSVRTGALQYLQAPNLRKVYRLYVVNNPQLEFVFIDKLYDVRILDLKGNPKLPASVEAKIKGVSAPLTEKEREELLGAEQRIRDLKIKLANEQRVTMPPTGHPTTFGGYTGYYNAYPQHYYNYWNAVRPYGYHYSYYWWYRH